MLIIYLSVITDLRSKKSSVNTVKTTFRGRKDSTHHLLIGGNACYKMVHVAHCIQHVAPVHLKNVQHVVAAVGSGSNNTNVKGKRILISTQLSNDLNFFKVLSFIHLKI